MEGKLVDTCLAVDNRIKRGRCERWWLGGNGLQSLKSNKNRKIVGKEGKDNERCFLLSDIIKYYNLKGIEFGNWMSQGERFDNIICCTDSLLLLERIFGKNLGADGNIGLAFGARGSSGANAHFEPSYNMVNLTKMRGAGSLAHEYGHALDFNLGAYLDQNKEFAFLSGGGVTSRTLPTNKGCMLRKHVNQIVDYIKTTESHKKLKEKSATNWGYWGNRCETFARWFEQYICYLTKDKDHYLCHNWGFYTKNCAYLTETEFAKTLATGKKLEKAIKKALK